MEMEYHFGYKWEGLFLFLILSSMFVSVYLPQRYYVPNDLKIWFLSVFRLELCCHSQGPQRSDSKMFKRMFSKDKDLGVEKKKEEKEEKKDKKKSEDKGAKPKQHKPKLTKQSSSGGKKKRRRKGRITEKVHVDLTKPLEFPTTPEFILEYHNHKNFLTKNEEWLLVELNEFECNGWGRGNY